jgi:hypothetical protein
MRTKLRSKVTLLFMTFGLLLAIPAIALADDISNNLDPTIDAAAEVMPLTVGGANGTTQLAVTPRNGDGKNGCNLTGSTSLGLSVSSSNTSVATVSPSSVTFTSCGDVKGLTVQPVAAGSATISVSQTSNNTGGTFNLAPATFTVNVTPPPNTAPTVTVGGVTGGASYAKGTVPNATCNVTDAEDGPSSFAATLSPVTGSFASDGIGQQTASCSYTDQGPGTPLTASASEMYSIFDPSGPVITKAVTPASPNGDNGWYKSGNVTVDWTVSDPESPNSIQTTGCDDQNITTDQAATTYSCSATSAGGSAAEQSVTIKRDATAPVINDDGTTQSPNGALWFNTAVVNDFSATDATSGLASAASFTKSSGTAEGSAVKINSGPVSDLAGNTNAGIDSAAFKIDLTKPSVNVTGVTNGATYTTGNVPTPGCNTTDGLSGVKDHATVSVTGGTGGFGTLTATCSGAVDNADNAQATTTPVSVTYGVSAAFNGFLQPIDGHSVNTGKWGRTYPIKWQLRDSSGALISDSTAQLLVGTMTGGQKAVSCGSFDLSDSDALEASTTGGTSLRYDATSDQFIYNYKAPSSGSCYVFAIRNADGLTTQQIDFQFTK